MLLVDFINVGYGDSILLREMADGAARFAMLVDCGDVDAGTPRPHSPRTNAAAYLRALGVLQLDLLVLSHLHLDHVGGIAPLLGLEIKELWTNYLPPKALWGTRPAYSPASSAGANNLIHSLQLFLPALQQLHAQGCRIRLVQQPLPATRLGDALTLRAACAPAALYTQQDAAFGRLLRDEDAGGLYALDRYINDTSIRLHLEYRGHTICLPGDATAPFWVAQASLSPCDLLKVPHHGHADSLNESLLQALRPDYAVVSVSNDRADCPAPAAMALLRAHASHLCFTDAVSLPGFPPAPARQAVRLQIDDAGIREVGD